MCIQYAPVRTSLWLWPCRAETSLRSVPLRYLYLGTDIDVCISRELFAINIHTHIYIYQTQKTSSLSSGTTLIISFTIVIGLTRVNPRVTLRVKPELRLTRSNPPPLAARYLEKKTRRFFDYFRAPPSLFPRVNPTLTRRLIKTAAPDKKNPVD